MRWVGVALAIAALAAGAGYLLTLPRLPALAGVTRVELAGPAGRLREITDPDTVARLASFAERRYPRWRSVLAPLPAGAGPLAATFYRGREALRTVRFGGAGFASCGDDFCVGEPIAPAAVREWVALLRVPTRLMAVPALAPAT